MELIKGRKDRRTSRDEEKFRFPAVEEVWETSWKTLPPLFRKSWSGWLSAKGSTMIAAFVDQSKVLPTKSPRWK